MDSPGGCSRLQSGRRMVSPPRPTRSSCAYASIAAATRAHRAGTMTPAYARPAPRCPSSRRHPARSPKSQRRSPSLLRRPPMPSPSTRRFPSQLRRRSPRSTCRLRNPPHRRWSPSQCLRSSSSRSMCQSPRPRRRCPSHRPRRPHRLSSQPHRQRRLRSSRPSSLHLGLPPSPRPDQHRRRRRQHPPSVRLGRRPRIRSWKPRSSRHGRCRRRRSPLPRRKLCHTSMCRCRRHTIRRCACPRRRCQAPTIRPASGHAATAGCRSQRASSSAAAAAAPRSPRRLLASEPALGRAGAWPRPPHRAGSGSSS